MSFFKNNLSKVSPTYIIAFLFIVSMVVIAAFFEDREMVLPEIAAMTMGLWVYQEKKWLLQPNKVFILPSLTALLGFGINMMAIPYSLKIALVLVCMLLIMRVINYSLPPALATGFLPIITNAHSWSFIYAIVVTTLILYLGIYMLKLHKYKDRSVGIDSYLLTLYACITLIWLGIAHVFEMENMALIPPIAVVLFETLAFKNYTLKVVVKQVAVLTLAISFGVLCYNHITNWIALAVVLFPSMYLLLRVFKMKIPAVYAFPFLVYVFPPERVPHLPMATFIVASFSFTMVYLIKRYEDKLKHIMPFAK